MSTLNEMAFEYVSDVADALSEWMRENQLSGAFTDVHVRSACRHLRASLLRRERLDAASQALARFNGFAPVIPNGYRFGEYTTLSASFNNAVNDFSKEDREKTALQLTQLEIKGCVNNLRIVADAFAPEGKTLAFMECSKVTSAVNNANLEMVSMVCVEMELGTGLVRKLRTVRSLCHASEFCVHATRFVGRHGEFNPTIELAGFKMTPKDCKDAEIVCRRLLCLADSLETDVTPDLRRFDLPAFTAVGGCTSTVSIPPSLLSLPFDNALRYVIAEATKGCSTEASAALLERSRPRMRALVDRLKTSVYDKTSVMSSLCGHDMHAREVGALSALWDVDFSAAAVPVPENDHSYAVASLSDAYVRFRSIQSDTYRRDPSLATEHDGIAIFCFGYMLKHTEATVDQRGTVRGRLATDRSRISDVRESDLPRSTGGSSDAVKLVKSSINTIGTWKLPAKEDKKKKAFLIRLIKLVSARSGLRCEMTTKYVSFGMSSDSPKRAKGMGRKPRRSRRPERNYFLAIRTVAEFDILCRELSMIMQSYAESGLNGIRKMEAEASAAGVGASKKLKI